MIKEKKYRSFAGKTENFKDNEERAFEKKHLRAYLKGKKRFRHGYRDEETALGSVRVPAYYEVKEEWSKKPKY